MKTVINITVYITRFRCNTNVPSLIRHHAEDGFRKSPNMSVIII